MRTARCTSRGRGAVAGRWPAKLPLCLCRREWEAALNAVMHGSTSHVLPTRVIGNLHVNTRRPPEPLAHVWVRSRCCAARPLWRMPAAAGPAMAAVPSCSGWSQRWCAPGCPMQWFVPASSFDGSFYLHGLEEPANLRRNFYSPAFCAFGMCWCGACMHAGLLRAPCAVAAARGGDIFGPARLRIPACTCALTIPCTQANFPGQARAPGFLRPAAGDA